MQNLYSSRPLVRRNGNDTHKTNANDEVATATQLSRQNGTASAIWNGRTHSPLSWIFLFAPHPKETHTLLQKKTQSVELAIIDCPDKFERVIRGMKWNPLRWNAKVRINGIIKKTKANCR